MRGTRASGLDAMPHRIVKSDPGRGPIDLAGRKVGSVRVIVVRGTRGFFLFLPLRNCMSNSMPLTLAAAIGEPRRRQQEEESFRLRPWIDPSTVRIASLWRSH